MSQFIEMFTDKGYPLTMIKSFADVSTGGTPSKAHPEYWNGDKPWVSAEDMKSKYVYDTCEKVTEAGYATCKIIPVDTLMYVCRGSIGVMAINKIECATNQSICRATCHNNVCNVEFLYHALMYQRDNIKKKGTGTSFKSLNQTTFSELEIELPPYDEQMKFVTIAEQADKSGFDGRKSQFIEMFKCSAEGVALSSLCDTFIDGDWIEAKDQSDSGIRLIQTGNVGVGTFKDKGDKARYISEDTFNRLNCTEVVEGDILISRLPDPVGRACIIPAGLGKSITAVDCTIIRLNDKVLPKFFVAFTSTPDYAMQIKKVLSGTTRLRVSRANLGKIQVPLPSVDKQQQFVTIAEQADKSGSVLQHMIAC